MAVDLAPKLRSAVSSAVFLVVVASMAVAGWALIERSEAAPRDTVRAQVPAEEAAGLRVGERVQLRLRPVPALAV